MNRMAEGVDQVSTHPCHRLSIPSARVFWCRHCMQQFEDPISRWRHSKTCKPSKCPYSMSQKVDKEADALRLATCGELLLKPKPEPAVDPNRSNLPYQCYICKKAFDSLQRMRVHVRYPCNRVGDVQSPPLEAEDEYIISTRKKETDWQNKLSVFCSNENEFQNTSSVPVQVIPNMSYETDVATSSCNFYPGTVGSNVEEQLFVTNNEQIVTNSEQIISHNEQIVCGDEQVVSSEEQVVQEDHDQPDIMNVCETVISSAPDETPAAPTPGSEQKVITVQGIEVFGTNDELYLSELLMQLSRGGFLFQNDASKDGSQQGVGQQQQQVEVVIHNQAEGMDNGKGDIQVIVKQEQIEPEVYTQNMDRVETVADTDLTENRWIKMEEPSPCAGVVSSTKTNQLRLLAAVTQDDLHQIERNQQVVINHMSSAANSVSPHHNVTYNSGAFISGVHTIEQNPEDFVSNQLSLLASVTSERLQSVTSKTTESCLEQGDPNAENVLQESNMLMTTQEVPAVVESGDLTTQQGSEKDTVIMDARSAQTAVLPAAHTQDNVLSNPDINTELVTADGEEYQKRKLDNYDNCEHSHKKHKPESV